MLLAPLARPPLYAVSSLVGVKLANVLRPVKVDATAAASSAYDGVTGALGRGDFRGAASALTGAGKGVASNVNGQVTSNIIVGIVGGCAVAAVLDLLFL